MFEKGIESFVTQMAATKAALAQIEQYVPEIRPAITGTWELREDQEPVLRTAIERRRSAAVAAERLFRQRREFPR